MGKGKVRKQSRERERERERESYARWPMATANHYLIMYDTTEKDRNICNAVGPRPPFQTVGSR